MDGAALVLLLLSVVGVFMTLLYILTRHCFHKLKKSTTGHPDEFVAEFTEIVIGPPATIRQLSASHAPLATDRSTNQRREPPAYDSLPSYQTAVHMTCHNASCPTCEFVIDLIQED